MEIRQRPRLHARDHLPGGADPIDFPALSSSGPGLLDTILSFGSDGLWKLDETSGLLAHDSSGNGHDLGITSGAVPTWGGTAGPPGTVAPTFATGDQIGTGSPSYSPNTAGDFTLFGWFLTSGPSSTGLDILAAATGTNSGWSIGVEGPSFNTGSRAIVEIGTGSSVAALEGDNALSNSTWYMLAVVHTGTTWKLYVNGARQTSTYTGAYSGGTPNIRIGAFGTSGQCSWVGFRGAALTDGDILAIYNAVTPDVPDGYVFSADGAGSTTWRHVVGTGGIDITVTSTEIEIDGSGVTATASTDGTTIDTNGSGDLEVKDGGITNAKVSSSAAIDLAKTKVVASPASDTTVSGATVDLVAGETLAFGDPVYVKSDGDVWKADADTSPKFPAIGIATGAATASSTVTVLLLGVARKDAWTWTVGGLVYLSTASGLTQTQPSATDNAIQVIGIATAATRLYVNPQLVYITHT